MTVVKSLSSEVSVSPEHAPKYFPVSQPRSAAPHGLRAAAGRQATLQWIDSVFSLPLVAAAAFALLVFCWIPKSMADADIWWHLRNATLQADMHGWLRQDVLSATAHGAAWMNHEWLSEVPFYLGWKLAGARGVLLVSMAVTEAVLLLVFLLCWLRTKRLSVTMVFSALAAVDATVSFGPRTLLFGWLCLAVELLLIERWCSGRMHGGTALWVFPALFALWVNLHGSWLIGLIVLGVFLGSNAATRASETPWAARLRMSWLHREMDWPRRRDSALWKAAGLSTLALLVNPYGWRLVAYPFDMAFKQTLNIASVEEWRTLDFHTPRAKIFLLMLLALFAVQLLRRTRWAVYELFFVAIGVYSAFCYSRFLFLAALLVCPVAARQVAQCFKRQREPLPPQQTSPGWRGLLHAVAIAAMVPMVAARFPSLQFMQEVEAAAYPRQALAMLRGFQPKGLVFNQYIWGGFLEWYAPQVPVFVDSRVDIFERNGTFKDYLDVVQLRHPLEILDRRGVRYVLFGSDAPLVLLLKATGKWDVLYQDRTTVLLQRHMAGQQ